MQNMPRISRQTKETDLWDSHQKLTREHDCSLPDPTESGSVSEEFQKSVEMSKQEERGKWNTIIRNYNRN